jgi:hypothetical protein
MKLVKQPVLPSDKDLIDYVDKFVKQLIIDY